MSKFLITLLTFSSLYAYTQDFIFDSSDYDFDKYNVSKKDYKIYQFLAGDSLSGKVSKIVKFNERGYKIYESTINYKTSKLTFVHDHIANFVYNENLLVKIETKFPNSINKSHSTFKYNSLKQLISITLKKFEKGIKTKVEKTNEGELLGEERWETKAKWTTDLKKYFKYDERQRIVKTIVPEKYKKSQNIYHYYYLDKNPIKITSYDNERLVWDEYRQYHNEYDYDYIRLWPDYDFKISEVCTSIGKVTFIFDAEDKILEISKPDYSGIRGNIKIRFSYNDQKLLSKVEIISVDNKIELTSLYIYD
ncbi:hypothetical protein ASG31_08565 [Chryseobacterium sp. Leaf404]|uniref:hypothetical protein n=1 Tax=unclassified Chryseobacterium TaxID=2593645 RepID=UPI0006F70C50|nr:MULTISPECIES: hypothetical protein [unclassified Chryseobacterium]KQT17451.1 hypothetical protein ASG31_08565 [Chryseobacterium sp. Leaf404]